MSNMKGTSWLATIEYMKKTKGEESIQRVLRTLDPQDQALLTRPILAAGWLDFATYVRFILAADKVLGKGDYQWIKDMAVFSAHKDFSGIYKFFISLTSPKLLINSTARLWRQLYDRGTAEIVWSGDKLGILTIRDFPDMPLHHEYGNGTYMEEALRMSGCKKVSVRHISCLARGEDSCKYSVSWE